MLINSMISRSDEKIRKHWNMLPSEVQDIILTSGFVLDGKPRRYPDLRVEEQIDTHYDQSRNHRIEFRVNKAELNLIVSNAKRNKMAMSAYCRRRTIT